MKSGILTGALMAALVTGGSAAFADGDAAKGENVFKKCKACHVADEEKNKVGPHLVNIVGRKAASVDGYKYSPAMTAKAEEGLVWDEANLSTYLTKPKDFVPKTKMAFAGLKKEDDRADLIAYLKSIAK